MKGYILSIAGIILISAVVTIVAPSGKMGKFIKGTAGLFILIVMVSPVAGWLKNGTKELAPGATAEVDGDYLGRCAAMLEERDEAAIAAYISEEFGCTAQVDVERSAEELFSPEKITVKLPADGINGDEARIHIMTRIRETLSARYGCEVEIS